MTTAANHKAPHWGAALLGVFHKVEDAFIVFVLLGMVALAVVQIVARNWLAASFVWIDPLLQNAVLWIAMLGAMIASRNDAHIRIDVVSEYAPAHWQRRLILLVDAFTAGITALMAAYSLQAVWAEREFSVDGIAGIPDWVLQLLIPMGFSIIALRYLLLLVLGVLNKRPKPLGTEVAP